MKAKSQLMTLALLILGSLAVLVQPVSAGELAGRIIINESGQPLVGATVMVVGNPYIAITDSTGRFAFPSLPNGVYNLLIKHQRFGEKTVRGVQMNAQSTDLTITTSADFSRWQVRTALIGNEKEEQDKVSVRSENRYRDTQAAGIPTPVADEALAEGKKQDGKGFISSSLNLSELNYSSQTENLARKQKGTRPPSLPESQDIGEVLPGGCIIEPDYNERFPHDMFFREYGTHRFINSYADHLSTFGLDVDNASYRVVTGYLQDGNLPPSAAIRPEEFINAFDYDYNPPDGEPFRVFTELTQSPFDNGLSYFKVAIKGREIEMKERQPINLTLVVDISGSMREGNRLGLVKQAIRTLVDRLNRNDQVGIVVYNTQARVMLEPIHADNRRKIFKAVDRLQAGGSTNAEAGLVLGYDMANRMYDNRRINKVILLSDGVANVGRTDSHGIMGRIERYARQGLTLSTFGVGMGNYNDVLLEQLAQKGDGNYAYLNNNDDVREQFVNKLTSNLVLLARDAKIQVDFNPEIVEAYRLIGFENRDIADNRFRDNRQDGGEIGAGHEVTALYEVILNHRVADRRFATVNLRWKNPQETWVTEINHDVTFDKRLQRFDRVRPELRLAVVAGRFAEMLKGTTYASETSWIELERLANNVAHDMRDEKVNELVSLIRTARGLSTWHTEIWDDDYRN